MQHTHRLVYLANHMFVDLPEGRDPTRLEIEYP